MFLPCLHYQRPNKLGKIRKDGNDVGFYEIGNLLKSRGDLVAEAGGVGANARGEIGEEELNLFYECPKSFQGWRRDKSRLESLGNHPASGARVKTIDWKKF